MAITGDWIIENCSTTGTGSLVLTGAITGFATFSAVTNDTDLVYYSIEDGLNRETGIGTYASAGNEIARTTVKSTLFDGVYTKSPGIGISLTGGSIIACTVIASLLNDKESTDQKGIADGYASLDATTKVPEAQIPTHTGDVTGDTALTVAADAITYAKIQNVAANNVILGNDTAVDTGIQELTATEVRVIINVADGADVTSTNETSHTDVLIDGEFATAGFMKTDGAGVYSISTKVAYTEMQNAVADSVIIGNNGGAGTVLQELTNLEVRKILNTWVAKTATYTAVSCDQIAADTLTTAAFTITLPITPNVGDIVTIIDSASNFLAANLTVARNLENINGAATDLVLNTDDSYTELRYLNSTYGWKSL